MVPLDNARYAINAANARWRSLYDTLYGGDMLPEPPTRQGTDIDPERAEAVVAWAADFLDRHLPLRGASHREITAWQVRDGRLVAHSARGTHTLVTPEAFRGWRGDPASPEVVLLRHHNLHIELCLDPRHPVGQRDTASWEVFEGLLDAFVTSLIALHDLNGLGRWRNSKTDSVYIVKPKMHGSEEVAFTCELFAAMEEALAMPRHTLKLGLMDEERRTALNLEACIHAARKRLIYINTGFLDRTGDEIHTNRLGGRVVRKVDMKKQTWIDAYEDWKTIINFPSSPSCRPEDRPTLKNLRTSSPRLRSVQPGQIADRRSETWLTLSALLSTKGVRIPWKEVSIMD